MINVWNELSYCSTLVLSKLKEYEGKKAMNKYVLSTVLCSFLLLGCESTGNNSPAVAEQPPLNVWINQELTDYLTQTLGSTPKFKDQPMLIVSMKQEQISADINNLTADIRSQLMDNLLASNDITLVRRQLDYQNTPQRSLTQLSCDKDQNIKYFLGVEVDKSSVSGKYSIRVRATDASNPDEWVRGISKKWTGLLSASQISALKQEVKDPYLQGLRSRPFGNGESDLLAQYLSYNMSCLLADALAGDIVLYTKPIENVDPNIATAVNLVDNYLSRFNEVSQTTKIENANAIMSYEFLSIDKRKNLSLLNLAINFVESGDRVPGVDTQAYVNIQPRRASVSSNSGNSSVVAPRASFIQDFSFVLPRRSSYCEQDDPWLRGEVKSTREILKEGDCFSIVFESKADINYVVYENTSGQIYLLDDSCMKQGESRTQTRIPAKDSNPPAFYLDNSVGFENFYLVSTKNSNRNSELNRTLSNLPTLCNERGQSIDNDELTSLLDNAAKLNLGSVDWKKIYVDHR
jgi:hypothetical protein